LDDNEQAARYSAKENNAEAVNEALVGGPVNEATARQKVTARKIVVQLEHKLRKLR